MGNITDTPANINTKLNYLTAPMIEGGTMAAADKLLYWDDSEGTIAASSYDISNLVTGTSMYSNHFVSSGDVWYLKGSITWPTANPGTDFSIYAGAATDNDNNGGNLLLDSGAQHGTGDPGQVKIGINNAEEINLFDVGTVFYSTDNLYIQTKDATATGDLIVATGPASSGNSGHLYLGVGTATATEGDVLIGTINATQILIGKSSNKVGFYGETPVVQASALTAKDTATVDGTYGSEEQGVIDNNRTRIEEIETILTNLGIKG